jgi:nicotinate-nucleotide adenylyltransferase
MDLNNKHNLNIGLLGGTFNPPHKGHLHISKDALKRFKLDYIWWIVSLQNPLKEIKAPSFESRIKQCNQLIDSKEIIVSDLERRINSNDTMTLLRFLDGQRSGNNYYWIMGSDIFLNFDQWGEWQNILRSIKIIVYDRPKYLYKDIKNTINPIILKYKKDKGSFLSSSPPGWTLIKSLTPNISSTEIRNQNEKTK